MDLDSRCGASRPTQHVGVTALEGGVVQRGDNATFRVWRGAWDGLQRVLVPAPRDDGSFSLVSSVIPAHEAPVTITIDGAAEDRVATISDASIELESPELLVSFEGSVKPAEGFGQSARLTYRAGVEIDTFHYVSDEDGHEYAAAFPHVAPTTPIVLGTREAITFDIVIPTVTLTATDDPARTLDASFTLSWPLGIVSRPVAP